MGADARSHAAIWRGGAARAAFLVLGRGCAFVSSILIVRTLSRDGSGSFFLVVSVAALLAVLLSLGLPEGIARSVAAMDAEGRGADAEALAATGLRATAGVAGVAVLLAAIVVVIRSDDWLPAIAALLGGVLALQAVGGAFLRARGRVLAAEVATGSVPPAFLVAVACIAAVVARPDVDVVVWTRVAIEAAAGLLLIGLVLRAVAAPRRPILPVIASVMPLWLTVLSWLAINQTDVILLGVVRGSADVAIYVPVLRTVELSLLAFGLFGAYVLPAASRLHAESATDELGDLYRTVSKAAYAIASPVLIAMVVAPDTVIETLFGVDASAVVPAARVLVAGYWINALLGFNGVVLEATGRLRTLAARSVAALLVTVAASLVLIPSFGVVGGAIGTAVGLTVLNTLNSALLWKATRIVPLDRGIVVTVAVSLPSTVIAFIAGASSWSFVTLVGYVAVAGIVTVGTAWCTTAPDVRTQILGAFRPADAPT